MTGSCGVLGVGYQGRDLDAFIAGLVDRGVTRVVDVRLTPISRKPGFSKTALRAALAEAGIAYEHRRELGNPKANRAGFAGPAAELARARAVYAALLSTEEAARSLDELRARTRRELVALLCFEADERRCHRQVILTRLGMDQSVGGSQYGSRHDRTVLSPCDADRL
jgi:uncharacterized protein (DUF488 family)